MKNNITLKTYDLDSRLTKALIRIVESFMHAKVDGKVSIELDSRTGLGSISGFVVKS
jgi:hypothetical protein